MIPGKVIFTVNPTHEISDKIQKSNKKKKTTKKKEEKKED